MVAQGAVRASGDAAADEEARAETEDIDASMEMEQHEDKPRYNFRTPAFHRMRFFWSQEERDVIDAARHAVDTRIIQMFPDAFQVLNDIWDVVREPHTIDGQVQRDAHGWIIWARTPEGLYIEDYDKLSHTQAERFLKMITVRLYAWEQKREDLWAEAMFAKARFEERFAIDFDAPVTGTVDDRRSRASMGAADERYFAIWVTHLSRRADALVRSMDRICQRLKDYIQA